MKPENRRYSPSGVGLIPVYKDWSLDNFDEGYVCSIHNRFKVRFPCHHRSDKNGWVYRNVVAYEAYHPGVIVTRDYVVHHIDGDKLNDSKENLQLLPRIEHANLHNPKVREKVVCDNCGEIVEKIPYLIKNAKHHFCSLKCKHEYGREIRSCLYCDKKFEVRKSDRNIFCSKSCGLKFRPFKKKLENKIGK